MFGARTAKDPTKELVELFEHAQDRKTALAIRNHAKWPLIPNSYKDQIEDLIVESQFEIIASEFGAFTAKESGPLKQMILNQLENQKELSTDKQQVAKHYDGLIDLGGPLAFAFVKQRVIRDFDAEKLAEQKYHNKQLFNRVLVPSNPVDDRAMEMLLLELDQAAYFVDKTEPASILGAERIYAEVNEVLAFLGLETIQDKHQVPVSKIVEARWNPQGRVGDARQFLQRGTGVPSFFSSYVAKLCEPQIDAWQTKDFKLHPDLLGFARGTSSSNFDVKETYDKYPAMDINKQQIWFMLANMSALCYEGFMISVPDLFLQTLAFTPGFV